MEEWKIFLTIGEILAAFFLVSKPLLKLNSTLTGIRGDIAQLREKSADQEKKLSEQKEQASESHRRLWAHESKQDERLSNHEGRIERLEQMN